MQEKEFRPSLIVFINEMKLKVNAHLLNQFIFYLFSAKLINKHRYSESKYFLSYIENFVPLKQSVNQFLKNFK